MAEESPKLAYNKRLIICADGTWLASDAGDKSAPSNIARLARAVATSGLDANGHRVKQVVSYHSGIGSGDLPFQKAINGGLGWGIDDDVCQLYDFISNNYDPGDEIFFFGFSRGAFTVRSAAGLVCDVGVLSAVHMSQFGEMWDAYRANTSGKPFRESTWYVKNKDKIQHADVRVKVVGVWDTVGALGIPEWPLVKWATGAGIPINKKYAFHNTKVSENLDYAFQALAIDETRITFPPTLWQKTTGSPAKDLQQCWFPGVHSNIGGGSGQAAFDAEEISYNTFAWMLDNVSGMLTFEAAAIKAIVEEHSRALQVIETTNGWGCGPLINNFVGSSGAFFWLLGRKDRSIGVTSRSSPAGTENATNEYIHPITRIRKEKLDYKPKPLEKYVPEKSKRGTGWVWMNKDAQPVPEYVMRPEKNMVVAYGEGASVQYRVGESLARLLCPKSILTDLDRDNGIMAEK